MISERLEPECFAAAERAVLAAARREPHQVGGLADDARFGYPHEDVLESVTKYGLTFDFIMGKAMCVNEVEEEDDDNLAHAYRIANHKQAVASTERMFPYYDDLTNHYQQYKLTDYQEINLVQYFTDIEAELYQQANSQEEYEYLLAGVLRHSIRRRLEIQQGMDASAEAASTQEPSEMCNCKVEQATKSLQERLITLIHGNLCPELSCTEDTCETFASFSSTITQLADCTDGQYCDDRTCAGTRLIIDHWKTCRKVVCLLCPLPNVQMQIIQIVGAEDAESDNLKQMPGDLFSLYQTLSFFEDSVDPSSSCEPCPSISSSQYSPFIEVPTCGQQIYEHNVTQYLANWIVRCLHARECPTRELCHIPGCGLLERILMHIPNCLNYAKCPYRYCDVLRFFLLHWDICQPKRNCTVCSAVETELARGSLLGRKRAQEFISSNSANSGPVLMQLKPQYLNAYLDELGQSQRRRRLISPLKGIYDGLGFPYVASYELPLENEVTGKARNVSWRESWNEMTTTSYTERLTRFLNPSKADLSYTFIQFATERHTVPQYISILLEHWREVANNFEEFHFLIARELEERKMVEKIDKAMMIRRQVPQKEPTEGKPEEEPDRAKILSELLPLPELSKLVEAYRVLGFQYDGDFTPAETGSSTLYWASSTGQLPPVKEWQSTVSDEERSQLIGKMAGHLMTIPIYQKRKPSILNTQTAARRKFQMDVPPTEKRLFQGSLTEEEEQLYLAMATNMANDFISNNGEMIEDLGKGLIAQTEQFIGTFEEMLLEKFTVLELEEKAAAANGLTKAAVANDSQAVT